MIHSIRFAVFARCSALMLFPPFLSSIAVYSVHLFDKAFRVFADQTDVAHIFKNLAGEWIALLPSLFCSL
jgi:hypothetical protein